MCVATPVVEELPPDVELSSFEEFSGTELFSGVLFGTEFSGTELFSGVLFGTEFSGTELSAAEESAWLFVPISGTDTAALSCTEDT